MPVSIREEAQPLDVMVELISRMDGAADESPRVFYDRLCEGLCELTSMTRAGLLLYDDLRKLVLPAGSHGVEPWLLDQVHGTLEETPVAQTALSEDRVVVVSHDLAAQIPARYAELGGFTTLTCTPVSAGGRWLGRDLRRPRRRPVRPDRQRARGRCGRWARPRRWPPACAPAPRRTSARGCWPSAWTWRARCTTA